MVDKKDVILEEIIEEVKPTDKETKSVVQKDTSNYSVNLFEGNRIVGQVKFDSASNSIKFSGADKHALADLKKLVVKSIAVAERTFNPVDNPKEWVQNLCNVAPLALYKAWSASEARKT
tara:strand:+ start:76 stop:432 length:357 start_codon:yes stop_codon:yes gene_type:complete